MKTIEEFYNEIATNTELAEAAFNAHTENRLAQFLNEHEVDGTEEAFEVLVNEKLRSRHELSDEELEQASGGFDNTPDGGEWAGAGVVYDINELVFEFAVEEMVFVLDQHIDLLIGKIEARKIQQDFDFAFPIYYVRFKDGSADWIGQACLGHITDMSIIGL